MEAAAVATSIPEEQEKAPDSELSQQNVDTGDSSSANNDTIETTADNATVQANIPDIAAEEVTPTPAPKPQPKLCGICEAEPGKYKCPRCALP